MRGIREVSGEKSGGRATFPFEIVKEEGYICIFYPWVGG